jgi:anti-sigma factor RsiW
MITRMPRSCVVHRAALLDFVDGQPRTAASAAALSHLDRCRACEEDLAGIVRTLAALRRLGRTSALVEPPAHAWPALRARVTSKRADRWLPRFSIAGLAVSTALVVMISLPATMAPAGFGSYDAERPFSDATQGDVRTVRPPAQRPFTSKTGASTVNRPAAIFVSGRRFDPRQYGEGSWSPAAGVPKPRPR